jgi:hypothetical protein
MKRSNIPQIPLRVLWLTAALLLSVFAVAVDGASAA